MNKISVFSGLPVPRDTCPWGDAQVASGVNKPMNKDTYVNKSVSDEAGVRPSGLPALAENTIGVEKTEKPADVDERVRRFWLDLMELTKRHEIYIMFLGFPLFEDWASCERKIEIRMLWLNNLIWDDIFDTAKKNGLRIRRWSVFSKGNEIVVFIQLRPIEA